MLRTQILFVQGFGASNFHIWHYNLGRGLELSLKGFRQGHEDTYDVSCQSAFFDNLSYFVGRIWTTFHCITCSLANYGFSTMACLRALLLVNQAASLSQHLANQRYDTRHKLTTMWKVSHGLFN
jgi:hypothetical protein